MGDQLRAVQLESLQAHQNLLAPVLASEPNVFPLKIGRWGGALRQLSEGVSKKAEPDDEQTAANCAAAV